MGTLEVDAELVVGEDVSPRFVLGSCDAAVDEGLSEAGSVSTGDASLGAGQESVDEEGMDPTMFVGSALLTDSMLLGAKTSSPQPLTITATLQAARVRYLGTLRRDEPARLAARGLLS